MILNTTLHNKNHIILIRDLIGPPFSLIERFKMRGVGSKRMMIEDVSQQFKEMLNSVSDINYANIELRSEGILLMVNKGLKNFTWVIPYYQLQFYKTSESSIHSQGNYIKFVKNQNFKDNKAFFRKMMSLKIKAEQGTRIDSAYDLFI